MRRIALPLSIVASLAVLDGCSGGWLGTGLSNTTSSTTQINSIVFQNGQNGPQANLFILTELGKATPAPTKTPGPPTPTPVPGSPTPVPTTTPVPTATPKPTPTPVYVVVSPAPPVAIVPGPGNRSANPLLILGIGEKNSGGVLGSIAVPSVKYQWAASYTPEGTIFNYTAGGGTITCGAPPPGTSGSGLYPIQIDVPFAATTNNSAPTNGDSIDPFGDGFYAIAALNANNQTVNFYNEIAFFAPLYTNSGKTYCITFVATGGGATGSVNVVIKT